MELKFKTLKVSVSFYNKQDKIIWKYIIDHKKEIYLSNYL